MQVVLPKTVEENGQVSTRVADVHHLTRSEVPLSSTLIPDAAYCIHINGETPHKTLDPKPE